MADESKTAKAEVEPKSPPSRGRTGGRAKGTPNKVTATALENVLAVFNRLDGTAGMAKWAKKHPTEFYKLYGKRIPAAIEVDATVDASVTVEVVRFTEDDTPKG